MTTSNNTQEVFRIAPIHYVHILNQNTNVTRVEVGPTTYICQDHESVVFGPEQMVIIPPQHYCIIENPCISVMNKDSGHFEVQIDEHGQVELRHGRVEVRLKEHLQNPFVLYPGEILKLKPKPLQMVANNEALHLMCLEQFVDENNQTKSPGEEWLFYGPKLYTPSAFVQNMGKKTSRIIKHDQALRLRASHNCDDAQGNKRIAGEEWLFSQPGAYLPSVYEEIVDIVDAISLTDCKSAHLRCVHDFFDSVYETTRKSGEEWLITCEMMDSYIPSVYEIKTKDIDLTVITSRQYCVITNPYNAKTGKNEWGQFRLMKGPQQFFLHPSEELRNGVEDVYVLQDEDGLILAANQAFVDVDSSVSRVSGEQWLIKGPLTEPYIPRVEVSVLRTVKSMAFASNEGVYVRDIRSGSVRSVIGGTLLLNEHEQLWEKEMPSIIEHLVYQQGSLEKEKDTDTDTEPETAEKKVNDEQLRDKTKIVTYTVPHNCCVQIYDYDRCEPRVVFGPNLVMLSPEEMFTPLCISGGKPKKAAEIQAIHLKLGPDFMTDILEVETSDHARLRMRLSYNWKFDLSKFDLENEELKLAEEEEEINSTQTASIGLLPVTALFVVPDFVGDACNHLASSVRAAVASTTFDNFHKNSARLIRAAVFGTDANDNVRNEFVFQKNALVISTVDIQEIAPINKQTQTALQRSVQLAIEITTASQEATARHATAVQEQMAKGKLQRQEIADECECEKARKIFYGIQAKTEAIKTAGSAISMAEAKAESDRIVNEAKIEQATSMEEATNIILDTELDLQNRKRKEELTYLSEKNAITADFFEEKSAIESSAFKRKISAIGANTIESLALTNTESNLALISSLHLKSTLVMDATKPVNLFNITKNLVTSQQQQQQPRRQFERKVEVEDEDGDDEEEY